MRRLMMVAALLALVAAACKIETNFGAVINADGSGTIIAEIGMDEEAQGFFLQDVSDPFEGNDMSECPGARTSEEQRGDLKFWIIECDVADITANTGLLEDNENSMVSDFSITVTDTLVTVSGSASAEDTLGSEAEGFDPGVLEDSISANVKITMPGRILEHNADSKDGNTLTWKVPILGGNLDIQATSDPTGPADSSGGGGFPTWLIAVIAVVVLAGGYYFMTQRKKGGSAPAAPAGDVPPPPPAQ